MGLELQQRKEMLEKKHKEINVLAREVISFNGKSMSIEIISDCVNKWKSIKEAELPEKLTKNKKIKIDERTEKINSEKAEIHKRLEEMIEKYRQEEAEIIKLEEIENRPDYIKDLINAGLLFSDGKRTIKKLVFVASFLRDKKYKYLEVSEKFFRETFRKPNGEEYGVQKLKEAVSEYNSP